MARRIREAVESKRSMLTESETSLNDRMNAVRQAVSAAYNQGPGDYTYCEVVFDSYVILAKSGKLWKVSYTYAADGTVTLSGEPVQVRVTYSPVKEARHEGQVFGPLGDDSNEPAPTILKEGEAKPTGKKWGVLIIQEGLSKNRNNYKRKVLQESAPLYEGARIFLDHEEGGRRFGRSTRDVAGFLKDVQPVLMTNHEAENPHQAPPLFGLGATAVVTKPAVREELLDAWDEGKSDLFGLSHDVLAESVTVMDPAGAYYDVTRIESVKSVDFVTNPAAGGRVLRLVASDTVPHTLVEDEKMLKKLIEAIRATKNAALIAKLEALGANPTEDQVLAIHSEALAAATTPPASPAPPATAPAATAGATTQRTEATPTPAAPVTPPAGAAQAGAVVTVQEAQFLEVRQDGMLSFLDASLAGVSLPEAVKAHLKTRWTKTITEATLATMPAKTAITADLKEQVELFGKLAEARVVVPAGGTMPRVEITKTNRQQVSDRLDAFFGVKVEGFREVPDGKGGKRKVEILKLVPAGQYSESFRGMYVDITGDANITGQLKEAVRLTEALDTSSFDQILGDSITRRMVAEYQLAPQAVWRGTIAEVVPLSDFRTQRRMRFGGYPNLATVSQGAPYPSMTSPTDEEATYAPAKRGGTEQITLEMITNDDVGAIRRIPQRMGRAASQTLYEFVFDFMRSNPLIYDGVALAAAGHGNNTTTSALAASTLVSARNTMKKQGDMSNSKRIGLSARYLWVPTDLEELGFQLTMAQRALPDSSIPSTAEPTAPNFIQKVGIESRVVDYWTDTNNWWVTADTGQTPMIEIGFLGGREDPELFVQDVPNVGSMFSNDQITYKIRHVYGGGVLDFRGFFGGIVP